tara:strand:- start:19345 stop:19953 length:609 start_codon:yes stop_codon:yes gene_type:complete
MPLRVRFGSPATTSGDGTLALDRHALFCWLCIQHRGDIADACTPDHAGSVSLTASGIATAVVTLTPVHVLVAFGLPAATPDILAAVSAAAMVTTVLKSNPYRLKGAGGVAPLVLISVGRAPRPAVTDTARAHAAAVGLSFSVQSNHTGAAVVALWPAAGATLHYTVAVPNTRKGNAATCVLSRLCTNSINGNSFIFKCKEGH